jgi:hypothetical protein
VPVERELSVGGKTVQKLELRETPIPFYKEAQVMALVLLRQVAYSMLGARAGSLTHQVDGLCAFDTDAHALAAFSDTHNPNSIAGKVARIKGDFGYVQMLDRELERLLKQTGFTPEQAVILSYVALMHSTARWPSPPDPLTRPIMDCIARGEWERAEVLIKFLMQYNANAFSHDQLEQAGVVPKRKFLSSFVRDLAIRTTANSREGKINTTVPPEFRAMVEAKMQEFLGSRAGLGERQIPGEDGLDEGQEFGELDEEELQVAEGDEGAEEPDLETMEEMVEGEV